MKPIDFVEHRIYSFFYRSTKINFSTLWPMEKNYKGVLENGVAYGKSIERLWEKDDSTDEHAIY